MPTMRFQEVELVVSESLTTVKSLNFVKWFSFTNFTMSIPSIDIWSGCWYLRQLCQTSGHCDSSLLKNAALLFFIIVPSLRSVDECWWYCNQLVGNDFPQVYVTTHGDCQNPPKEYISVKYQLPILSLERAVFISPKVDSLHFFRGSQKCFVCVSPNHYLTKSLQITLLLSGMQIVEFSASVDAFWRVIMFIRWSGT